MPKMTKMTKNDLPGRYPGTRKMAKTPIFSKASINPRKNHFFCEIPNWGIFAYFVTHTPKKGQKPKRDLQIERRTPPNLLLFSKTGGFFDIRKKALFACIFPN